ncbi:MAG TPA: hypothetical protein VJC13_02950 [Candidatus Paceibacterota bacterium]|nr:hypothetical protein [uncultured archaeon]
MNQKVSYFILGFVVAALIIAAGIYGVFWKKSKIEPPNNVVYNTATTIQYTNM